MKKFKKPSVAHLFLPVSFVFIVIMVMLKKLNPVVNITLVITCLFFYIIFALLHHHFDRSLKLELVIEYVLLGILILIMMQTLLV